MTKIMSDTTFFGILLGGILLSSGVLVGDAYGAVFAKYDGIDGESTDSKHKEWIDVLSIDWGMHKDKANKIKPAKNVIDNFQMTMEYEKSSPKLLEAALTGKVIPKLEIQLTKIGCPDPPRSDTCTSMEQVTYLKYELINVRVTSYDVNGSGGADEITLPPTVVLSNNFEEIKVTYTEYDDEGKNKGNVETEHKIGKGE
jgi:type VI secretion system secreted protein Hcp